MNIKMKNIISITEARSNIFDIAKKIQRQGNHYIFTENGKPKIAVMSADEYENLMEDLFLASDPKFAAEIKKSEEEFARGEYSTWEEVKANLDQRRNFVVADKSKKGYSAKNNKKHK